MKNPLLALILILLFAKPGISQDYPYEVEQFSFIDYDQNHLQFPSGQQGFEKLYTKIDTLLFRGKGQINVVHVGGSHIQADMWSDRMRQRLQTFFPGNRGSRGLLFPFRMAKTNNPSNYKAEFTGDWTGCRCVQRDRGCTFGLTGINVTTNDTLTTIHIYFRGEDYPQYAFDRVRVFHDLGPDSYDIRVANDSVLYTYQKDENGGFVRFQLGEFLTELKLEIRKTEPGQDHFTLYGISLESEDPGFIYHSIGVNGAATTSYKRCQLWEQHLKAIKPDLVIFSVGINDAHGPKFDPGYYERNYDELARRVFSANPDAAILFTTNNDSYYKRYPNKNAEKVRDAMMNLARRHDGAVWDMYGVMGGLGSIKTWVDAGLANPDKIHLLKPGYVLVGDLMFNALMQAYDVHLKEAARIESKNR